MDLNIADGIVIALVLFSTIIGAYRGFIREIVTIFTWIIAGYLAYLNGNTFGRLFTFVETPAIKEVLGTVLVFFMVLILAALIKFILYRAFTFSKPSPLDRTSGALFGFIRASLIIIVILLIAPAEIVAQQPWYKSSLLMPKYEAATIVISKSFPKAWREELKAAMDAMLQQEAFYMANHNKLPPVTPEEAAAINKAYTMQKPSTNK